MSSQSLQFECPSAAFLLLFVFAIVLIFFFIDHVRQSQLHAFAEQSVLEAILEKREPVIFWIKVFLYCLAWIGAVLALMGPKGNERYVSTAPNGQVAIIKPTSQPKSVLRRKTHEVIFLIDASASMNSVDMGAKTRLDLSKEIVDDVIRSLKGENVSLYAFTSATIQIVPSTLDYLFTRLMLQQIEINEGETKGTAIKQAIDFLRRLYFAKPSAKTKTLIILSDGGDTGLLGLDAEKRKQEIADIASPLADARQKNLRVLAVGLGSALGSAVPGISFQGHPVLSALDEALMRKLAIVGDGELFVVGQMSPFQISQALYQQIARDESFVDASIDLPPPDMGDTTHVYDLYFQFPLGIAILALVGFLLLPDTTTGVGRKVA